MASSYLRKLFFFYYSETIYPTLLWAPPIANPSRISNQKGTFWVYNSIVNMNKTLVHHRASVIFP